MSLVGFTELEFELECDNNMVLFDFKDVPKPKNETKEQTKTLYDKQFDNQTETYYKLLRKGKFDAISSTDVPHNLQFEFKEQWDPLTGERLTDDPYGPLVFDVHYLIKYFFTKRYEKLWNLPTTDNGQQYQGYYDDGVGAGEKFYVHGRGHFPEWYLFRLPITDCYLTKDHNPQFITISPKLTVEEINKIYELALNNKSRYHRLFNSYMPNLVDMYNLYNKAISETATPSENRKAVDKLVKLS